MCAMIQRTSALIGLCVLASSGTALAQAPLDSTRFEKTVVTYEAGDKTAMPPRGAILLAGDSQFYRWKTVNEDLPDFTVVNRGIDSFQTPDLLFYFDRLVLPYKPRFIVLHVGGNDIHNGRMPAQVLEDFKTFVGKVRATQKDVPIAFTSITPSPGRWSEKDQRIEANRLIKSYVATQRNLHFIDLWDAFLKPDGTPNEGLYVEDRIHPNHEGYLVRVKIMRPLLGKPDKAAGTGK